MSCLLVMLRKPSKILLKTEWKSLKGIQLWQLKRLNWLIFTWLSYCPFRGIYNINLIDCTFYFSFVSDTVSLQNDDSTYFHFPWEMWRLWAEVKHWQKSLENFAFSSSLWRIMFTINWYHQVTCFWNNLKETRNKAVFMLRENWINNEAKDFSCYDIFWKQQTKVARDSRRFKAAIQIFRSGTAHWSRQWNFSGP